MLYIYIYLHLRRVANTHTYVGESAIDLEDLKRTTDPNIRDTLVGNYK